MTGTVGPAHIIVGIADNIVGIVVPINTAAAISPAHWVALLKDLNYKKRWNRHGEYLTGVAEVLVYQSGKQWLGFQEGEPNLTMHSPLGRCHPRSWPVVGSLAIF